MTNIGHYVRSAGVIGLSTFVSRLLGLMRDIALAAVFGASWILDAFLLAFTIPNLFRQFFGEGAVSTAFLPTFTEVHEKEGPKRAWQFASKMITLLCIVLVVLTLLGIAVTWGLSSISTLDEKNQLALRLSACLMPYLTLICLAAFLGAILNSLQHFFMPALSPIVLNIFWIAGIYWIAPLFGQKQEDWVYGMSLAIVISGIAQVILQYPALKSCQVKLRPNTEFHDPAIQKVLTSLGPIILGAAAVQINVVVDRLVAWFMIPGDGALTILYMANRLMQFPLAIIGISIATVAFPLFSKFSTRQQWGEFQKAVPQALRISLLIALPASVGLILLADPIIHLIYNRRQFDTTASLRTVYVLIAYSSGLWLYILMQLILRAIYALGDMKTPMYISLLAVFTNLVWNILLVGYWQETGLAIATSCNALLQVSLLLYFLQKKMPLVWAGTWISVLKCILATAIMSLATFFSYQWVHAYGHIQAVFVPIFVGIVVYAVIGKCLNIQEFNYIVHKIIGRLKR